MKIWSLQVKRGQIIGAVLAWLLVGSLLLMRSFSVSPEAQTATMDSRGEAGAEVVSQPPSPVPEQTDELKRVFSGKNAPMSTGSTATAAGLPGGEDAPPLLTMGSASPVPTDQMKPARAILGDEGGIYYFTITSSSDFTATPTWFVRYFTPRPTSTPAPTYTVTSTRTPRATCTPRYTATMMPTPTPKATFTPTPTLTATGTPTPSATFTLTSTLTVTNPPTPSATPTASLTPTFTNTPSETPTFTETPTETVTPTEIPTEKGMTISGSFAFVSRNADCSVERLNLVELPGLGIEKIADLPGVELCSWSPDGSRLLVKMQRGDSGIYDLHLVMLDGTVTPVTDALPGSSHCGDWGFDGDTILFPYTDGSGITSLEEIELAMGGLRQVYQDENEISRPQISPDGGRVVFITHDGTGSDLALLETDTGAMVRLTNTIEPEDTPSFSPEGLAVVFARLIDERWQLFYLDLETQEETVLGLTTGNEIQPDWSPDGQTLLFTSDGSGVRNIYIYKIGEAAPYQLLPDTAIQDTPLWRP